MVAAGKARMETQVIDLSVLVSGGLKGITAVAGRTERGVIGKPKLIGSWPEYVANFGGLLQTDDFPFYCRRAFDNRARLLVCPLGHYSNIADATTLTGKKAAGKISVLLAAGSYLEVDVEANSIGLWGNKVSLSGALALSGIAGAVDITIMLDGSPDLTETIKNVVAVTGNGVDAYSVQSNLVHFTAVTHTTTATAAINPLAGGVDTGELVDTDYIGDAIAGTGIHGFDNNNEANKVAIPAKAVPAIDYALVQYAQSRGDMRAITRTPVGISGFTAVEYREVTGLFSGAQAIDSWYGSMIYGTITVPDPFVSGATKDISPIGDILGIYTNRDTRFREWYAAAGYKRGRLFNVLAIPYNLDTPAKSAEADLVDTRGLNVVINHNTFGPIFWGNGTLQRQSTLLSNENVAELVIYLIRNLPAFIETELFEPNDPTTWAAIYRNVKPFLDAVVTGRGMYDYLWQGDQDVDTIDDCVVNKPDDIDLGKYVVRLFIKPETAMKYVALGIVVTKSGVSFSVLGESAELGTL